MGLEFITRTIRTTAILALIAALALSVYSDWKFGVGLLIGTSWGLANLYFLKRLITEVISPGNARLNQTIVLMLLKFPLLYVGGYFLVSWEYFSVYSLLAGFSLIFAVMLLKVIGRVMMGMDTPGLTYLSRKRAEGAN
jgi:hypothetical protein